MTKLSHKNQNHGGFLYDSMMIWFGLVAWTNLEMETSRKQVGSPWDQTKQGRAPLPGWSAEIAQQRKPSLKRLVWVASETHGAKEAKPFEKRPKRNQKHIETLHTKY